MLTRLSEMIFNPMRYIVWVDNKTTGIATRAQVTFIVNKSTDIATGVICKMLPRVSNIIRVHSDMF